MTRPVGVLLLLVVALLVTGGPAARRRLRRLAAAHPEQPSDGPVRLVRAPWLAAAAVLGAAVTWLVLGAGAAGLVAAAVVAGVLTAGLWLLDRRALRGDPPPSAGGLAAGWELLATCLESGLPVPSAIEAAARRIGGPVGAGLRRAAGLLELGSSPADAWTAVGRIPGLEAFGRAARRSADTGAGLARVARAEAARLRAALTDEAEARAERAAVLITAPLGLCFLPAFLALGIAPVVIGLAGEALARW